LPTLLVAYVPLGRPLNIEFTRALTRNKWDTWLLFVPVLMKVNLTKNSDVFGWKLNTSGTLTIKSMYSDFMNEHTGFLRKHIWTLRVPPRIKNFMRFLSHTHKRQPR
jgi:hypothetical protein